MAAVGDLGIDVGSSNILIHERGKGIVRNVPALLAFDHSIQKVLFYGEKAAQLVGREPSHIQIFRPLQNGVIHDYKMLTSMLHYTVHELVGRRVVNRPRAVMAVSAVANELEKRQLIIGMFDAGARRTQLIDRPLAAALGAMHVLKDPYGRLVADIGGATTDIAVIAGGQITSRTIIQVAGDTFTDAIIRYIRLKHNLLIGFRTAEDIKRAIGTVYPLGDAELSLPVAGRNLISGLPKQIDIYRDEVAEAMEEALRQLLEGLHGVIERIPPELANDVFENGILLTGGGAMLKGLQEAITEEMQIRCTTADQPQECVARGCGYAVEHLAELAELTGENRRKGT